MKTNIKVLAILIVLLGLILSITIYNINSDRGEQRLKIKLLQDKVLEYSDIEILESKANENATLSKSRLTEIEQLKSKITMLETMYEQEILTQRCYESQIDRKINGLEYNLEYCEDKTNLDQFRKK